MSGFSDWELQIFLGSNGHAYPNKNDLDCVQKGSFSFFFFFLLFFSFFFGLHMSSEMTKRSANTYSQLYCCFCGPKIHFSWSVYAPQRRLSPFAHEHWGGHSRLDHELGSRRRSWDGTQHLLEALNG